MLSLFNENNGGEKIKRGNEVERYQGGWLMDRTLEQFNRSRKEN